MDISTSGVGSSPILTRSNTSTSHMASVFRCEVQLNRGSYLVRVTLMAAMCDVLPHRGCYLPPKSETQNPT